MPEIVTRLRGSLVFASLVIFALVTMISDRRSAREGSRDLSWWSGAMLDVAVPVEKLVSVPVHAVRRFWNGYVDLLGVRSENEQLRERLAALEEENLQYREALIASGHLARIAEMRNEYEIPMRPAQVVGLDVSPWFRTVLLDRGRREGVRSGMPVVTASGLVGLVTATSRGAAKTMLLLDRQSAIDGIVQRSRTRGIVRGLSTEDPEFEFVVRGSDLRVGDVVITSGLDGVYPKGLRIGEVAELEEPGSSLLQKATIHPAVDFGRMEQVFVMLRRTPSMELLYAAEGQPTQARAPADAAPGS